MIKRSGFWRHFRGILQFAGAAAPVAAAPVAGAPVAPLRLVACTPVVFALAVFTLAAIPAGVAVAAPPDSPAMALVGGKIMTQTDAGVIDGTIVLRDGVIISVGEKEPPADAVRVDIQGMTVTPGLIDVRSTLWLAPSTAREGGNDGQLDALDGVDLFREDWHEVIRQGVTAVYVQPASSGILGGRGAVLRVAPAASLDELVLKSSAAIQASLGVASNSRTSRERHAQFEQLKKVFEAAKQYDLEWTKYEQSQKQSDQESKTDKTGDSSAPTRPDEKPAPEPQPKNDSPPATRNQKPGETKPGEAKPGEAKPGEAKPGEAKPGESKPGAVKRPRRDEVKDFLRTVLAGTVPVRMEVHRDDDIVHALKLAETFHLRILLDGVSQPRMALPELRAKRIPLILGPIVEIGEVPSYRERRPDGWLESLTAEDVRWSLGTFGEHPRSSRLLRVHAAAAVAAGVPAERVMTAMTRHAAAILGVDDKIGSIAPGKQADLAIFAGPPLDPSTPVRMVISRGKVVYDRQVSLNATPAELAVSPPAAAMPSSFILKTTRCLTDAGTFEPRHISIKSGRLVSIEPPTAMSPDAPIIDVGTSPVTPGLVAGHTDLGMEQGLNETGDTNAAYLRAADVYDPAEATVGEYARGGFLSLVFIPGSSNVVVGCVAAVRPGANDPVADSQLATKIVFSEQSRSGDRFPSSLAGQLEIADDLLDGRAAEPGFVLPNAVRDQLLRERQQLLEKLLSQQRPALIEVREEGEIDAALRWIERRKIRGVLVAPEKCDSFLTEIQRVASGVVFRTLRAEDYDRYLHGIVAASRAGIPLAFGAGSAEEIRMTAALAVNAGMSREAALKALTSDAARILGLPPGMGRFQAGQPADLVIWSGSPLDLAARPLAVFLDGKTAGGLPGSDGVRKQVEQRLARQESEP